MIQDIFPKKYFNHYEEQEPEAEDWLLVYEDGKILCQLQEKEILYLKFGQVCQEKMETTYLFTIDDEKFFLLKSELEVVPEGYTWEAPVVLREAVPKHLGFAGVTGMQLDGWYKDNRYCGRCGKKMRPDHKERMMRCECGNMVFPKICPGVIVAVTDGDRILLTKYARRGAVNYSLVAGFTEIGETLEETVQREVMEEVGLHVKNIRYYKDQPWSFSSTLLCGFFCDVDGDRHITLDTEELALGEWFHRDHLPITDDGVSLTREMIGIFQKGLEK